MNFGLLFQRDSEVAFALRGSVGSDFGHGATVVGFDEVTIDGQQGYGLWLQGSVRSYLWHCVHCWGRMTIVTFF